MRKAERASGLALAALALLALIASHSGSLFAPGDSLAVGRPVLLFAALVAAVILWRRGLVRLALVAVAGTALSAWVTLAATGGAPRVAGALLLYQKNLLYGSRPLEDLQADLLSSGADLLTLQEWSAPNFPGLAQVAAAFPHQVHCGYLAVLSKHPLVPGTSRCEPGLALAQVRLPGAGPVWVASIHLYWPWPRGQFPQVGHFSRLLADLDGPVIIGGDFNMLPWGASLSRVSRAAGGQRLAGYHGTYTFTGPLGLLDIDHVLVPDGATGTVELRPAFGSDHLGVLARIALPQPPINAASNG